MCVKNKIVNSSWVNKDSFQVVYHISYFRHGIGYKFCILSRVYILQLEYVSSETCKREGLSEVFYSINIGYFFLFTVNEIQLV
jgi:hypothetical protein